MLQETLAPGATVMAVAKRHGVGTGQIYSWRRQTLARALAGLVPVMIGASGGAPDGSPPESALPEPRSIPSQRGSLVEIELPSGIRLRVESTVDVAAVKGIYFDAQGLVLYAKRLKKGRFVWPQAKDGMTTLTAAQLSMLAEGIDWRMPA
jgi:transposase-like protein